MNRQKKVNFLVKNVFIKVLFSLFFSIIIIGLSFYDIFWINFWGSLHVPPMLPAFSDFNALNIFLEVKNEGLNPYYENSDKIYTGLAYPSIWLNLVEFLNLKNIINFKICVFIILFLYFYILIDLAFLVNNKIFNILLGIFFFSTSNFLLLERLNIDIIIFSLIYLLLINKKPLTQLFLFMLSFVLKIYPIFSIFVFIDKKKYFFLIFIFILIYLFFMRGEILLMTNNIVECALTFCYGVGSISKAIYFYSIEYNYFINENNYDFFRNIMVMMTMVFASIVILSQIKFQEKNYIKKLSIDQKMFLTGAGIYLGTFATTGNVDYRLVYLLFTIPYLLKENYKTLNYIYFFSIIFCFNSLVIEGGNPYSLFYFIKGSAVHFLKFIIFIVNCYYFGKILNSFIDVSFLVKKK